jgi:hypothetical protein
MVLASKSDKVAAVDRGSPEANNDEGIRYSEADNTDLALKYFQLAVRGRPDSAEYRNNVGVMHMRRGIEIFFVVCTVVCADV